jgi:AraC family transcriptional regulator
MVHDSRLQAPFSEMPMPELDVQPDPSISFVNPSSMVVVPQESGAARISVQSSPTDKYGVAVARISYGSKTSISGTTTHHMIGIICSEPVRTEHMIEGKRLRHVAGPGCLCIRPAGAQHFTAFDRPMEGVVLQVSPECLTLAKADLAARAGELVERMDGEDPSLTRIAEVLDAEAAANHPNGMLFWSSVTDALLEHLAAHHLSAAPASPQGLMHASALKRLEDFILSNLAEPLDLGSLAAVVRCNRFHFARRFRATVGVSPHRYVVRRRLQRARALLRAGEDSLAQIAAATGFTDQSHLSNWIRRVYGTTPMRLAATRLGCARICTIAPFAPTRIALIAFGRRRSRKRSIRCSSPREREINPPEAHGFRRDRPPPTIHS